MSYSRHARGPLYVRVAVAAQRERSVCDEAGNGARTLSSVTRSARLLSDGRSWRRGKKAPRARLPDRVAATAAAPTLCQRFGWSLTELASLFPSVSNKHVNKRTATEHLSPARERTLLA